MDVSLRGEEGGKEKMGNIRKRHHDAALKAKVALEAVKGDRTISEISSEYGVHPNLLRQWKKQLLEELSLIFTYRKKKAEKDREGLD